MLPTTADITNAVPPKGLTPAPLIIKAGEFNPKTDWVISNNGVNSEYLYKIGEVRPARDSNGLIFVLYKGCQRHNGKDFFFFYPDSEIEIARVTREHTWTECDCYVQGCHICDGGLSVCKTCGLLEGALTLECLGSRATQEQTDAVYAGGLDYYNGQWQPGKPSIHSPAYYDHLKRENQPVEL